MPLFFSRSLLAFSFAPVLALAEPNVGPPLSVAVRSASGAVRQPAAHDGMIDRVSLRPSQTLTVVLARGTESSGTQVGLTALDGGEVAAADSLSMDATGEAQFAYTAAAAPGPYRFLIVLESSRYLENFCVLNLGNPAAEFAAGPDVD